MSYGVSDAYVRAAEEADRIVRLLADTTGGCNCAVSGLSGHLPGCAWVAARTYAAAPNIIAAPKSYTPH